MKQLGILLCIGSLFVFYLGYQEFAVGRGASSEPFQCQLRDLEAGQDPPDKHIEIGHHWAIFPAGVAWGPEDSDKLDYIYYPIVSEEHPYNKAWDALLARYGRADVPEREWPKMKSLAVLVKTEKYKTMSAVPDQWQEADRIRGLIINDIEELKSEEKRLLNENFPGLELDDVLIVEEGREPKGILVVLGMFAGGLVLAAAGILVLRSGE